MNVRTRRLILVAGLLATLLAAYLAPQDGTDTVAAVPVRPQTATPVARPLASVADAESEVLAILSRDEDTVPDTVFGVPSAGQPTAAPAPVSSPPPPPPEPAPPTAPPLPFQVLGRAIEDGKVTLFLRWGERNILARVGDTVEGQYRLESEDGRTLHVRYLPLDQLQSLTISAGK